MMAEGRASIFGDDDLDVSSFAPKAKAPEAKPAVKREQIRQVSEAANFRSREPQPHITQQPPPARAPRRYRTGRNVQLNIKVRPEAVEAFYALADRQGWVLGEAFEHAVNALTHELAGGKAKP